MALRPYGRSPYGERGLKCVGIDNRVEAMSRSPYGERGLKLIDDSLHRIVAVALLTESVD